MKPTLVCVVFLLGWLGSCYAQTSLNSHAQRAALPPRVLRASVQPPVSSNRIDRLCLQAEKALKKQQYPQAIALYRQAQAWCREDRDFLRLANTYSDLSTVFYEQTYYEKALAECLTGLRLLPRNQPGSDSVQFKLNSYTGSIHVSLNRLDSSQHYFDQAESLLNRNSTLEASIPLQVTNFYSSFGAQFNNLANYDKTLIYLQKALNIAKRYELMEMYEVLYNNIGSCHHILGNDEPAIHYYELALAQTKTPMLKVMLRNNIGSLYLQSKDYPQATFALQLALTQYNRLVRVQPSQQNREYLGRILTNLGTCYTRTGRFNEARRSLAQARTLFLRVVGSHHPRLTEVYIQTGELAEARNRWMDALASYQKALNTLFLNGYTHPAPPDDEAISVVGLFDVLRHQAAVLDRLSQHPSRPSDLRASLATYQSALLLSDKIRRSYEGVEAKLFFTQQARPVYEQALDVAYRLYEQTKQTTYRDAAFDILEGSKSAALADALREARIKPATLPARLLNEEKRRNARISDLKTSLAMARTPGQIQALKSTLVDEQLQLNQLLRQFDRISPRYYRFKYIRQTVPLSQVQRALPDTRTALLSYFLGNRYMYTFVVSRQGTFFRRSVTDSAVSPYLDTLRQSLYINPGLDTYRGSRAAQRAYRTFVAPFAGELQPIRRLIVLRDAELHFIPFEVLESQPDQYLLQQYSIRYAYSATLLFDSTRHNRPHNLTTLALAPYADSTGLTASIRNEGMGALPASYNEVKRIGGKVLLNRAATKEAFLRNYHQYGLLHLATHAHADGNDPAQSYIAFYPNQSQYKLYTNELYNLSLNHAQLVVLSACETGTGLLQRGEGIMSLARAFTYAGCPSVITTLWNAHDESSAFLSERLHHHLREGLPSDDALQRAKLDYRQSELGRPYNHPYYWANFVLIGEATPLYLSGHPDYLNWRTLGGAATLVIVGILVWLFAWGGKKGGMPPGR